MPSAAAIADDVRLLGRERAPKPNPARCRAQVRFGQRLMEQVSAHQKLPVIAARCILLTDHR